MPLKVLALNCSLKRTGESSSTDRLLKEVRDALGQHDAEGEIVRVAALEIKRQGCATSCLVNRQNATPTNPWLPSTCFCISPQCCQDMRS